MDANSIFDRLAAKFSDGVSEFTMDPAATKDPFCVVQANRLWDVCRYLRDESEFKFDFLQNVTAVDWIKKEQLQVVYHLYSYKHRHSFVLKVNLPRQAPLVPSVVSLWKTANWLEREQYDLFGVIFEGHPDLRRLLMPDDWKGHPMRKDAQESAEYRGMPTSRYSPLDLLVAYDKAKPQVEGERPRMADEESSQG